jgi:hypothetical protein
MKRSKKPATAGRRSIAQPGFGPMLLVAVAAAGLLGAPAATARQGAPAQAPAPAPTPQQRVGLLKQWLAASQQQMHHYVWIETTTIRLNGEVKSQVQKKCFYAPDGTLQKVQVSQAPEKSSGLPGILPPGRLLEKVEEHKKEEMKDYMQKVEQLLHSYIPVNPALMQQAVDGGRLSVAIVQPGVDVRLNFGSYLKQGDTLGIDVNPTTNQLLGVHISSYVDSPDDAVKLDATTSVLADGTIYLATATVDAASKGVTVNVQNSDFVKGTS